MVKKIPIHTNLDSIFKQYLYIMNSILSKNSKLTDIEIDVLDKLLFIDYKYRHLSKEKRDELLFHSETKKRIRQSVFNISINSYNNIITSLRKKKFIVGRTLRVNCPIDEKGIKIEFDLQLNDNSNN